MKDYKSIRYEEPWYVSAACAVVLLALFAVILTAPEWGQVIDNWSCH